MTDKEIVARADVAVKEYDKLRKLSNSKKIEDVKIGEKTPGWHEFTWQGTDSHGQQVSTGMYLITMRAGEYFQKQKVTFLK